VLMLQLSDSTTPPTQPPKSSEVTKPSPNCVDFTLDSDSRDIVVLLLPWCTLIGRGRVLDGKRKF